MAAEGLCDDPAHLPHERILKKETSAREVVDAHLDLQRVGHPAASVLPWNETLGDDSSQYAGKL